MSLTFNVVNYGIMILICTCLAVIALIYRHICKRMDEENRKNAEK